MKMFIYIMQTFNDKLSTWHQAIFFNEKLLAWQKAILGKHFSIKSLLIAFFISSILTATIIFLGESSTHLKPWQSVENVSILVMLGFICDYLALITTFYFIQIFKDGKTLKLIVTALLVSVLLSFISLYGISFLSLHLDEVAVFKITIDTFLKSPELWWYRSDFLFSITPLIPIILYSILFGLWIIFISFLRMIVFIISILSRKAVILTLSIVAIVFSGIFFIYLPDKAYIDTVAKYTRVIVRKDGNQIKLVAVINNTHASLENLPDYLKNALIAMEDRRFYDHFGIDVRGLARAFVDSIKHRKFRQGGSTLTQQLVKNMLLFSERSFERKIKEALLALKLEIYYDKDEILEMYLNQIPFGKGAYGIETAAMKFLKKHSSELNLYEAALLIGSIPQPERFNLLKNPKLAHQRAHLVLDTMVKKGYITEKKAKYAKRQGIKKGNRKGSNTGYRYLLDWAHVRKQLFEHFGDSKGDLTIITTLDPNRQKYAELAVRRWLSKTASRHVSQGALLAMDMRGAIRAIVGGKIYNTSQYNRAIQAERQPGSAFKPFVYLAALMQGFSPTDKISDQPININGWQPRNIDRQHLGLLTLIEAIRRSRNVATVRLMEKIGQKPVVELARHLGITTTQKWRDEPGLALGTGEVRLIDMVCANVVFANGGYKVSPYGILGIRDKKGNLLYWRSENSNRSRLVKYKYIATLNRMLRTVVSAHGTGANAAFGNHQTAGKTGTTNDYRDAWFIGYTAYLVTGVWVGNDEPTEFMNGVTGGEVPAKIFRNFMANVHQGLESKPLLALK